MIQYDTRPVVVSGVNSQYQHLKLLTFPPRPTTMLSTASRPQKTHTLESSQNPPNMQAEVPMELLGSTVVFNDASPWKLVSPLSKIKYQQGEPPFKTRQVFEATCVRDPEHKHCRITTVVIKVKYQ